MSLGHRAFLTVGNSGDTGLRDAVIEQIPFDGVRAALAERDVVFIGTAFVAVSLDPDGNCLPWVRRSPFPFSAAAWAERIFDMS